MRFFILSISALIFSLFLVGTASATSPGDLQSACDQGNNGSCYQLGMMYLEGEGVTKDNNKARALMTKVCNAGLQMGCSVLGTIPGSDVADNSAKLKGFEKKCGQGKAKGCYSAADLHHRGDGVAKNRIKALSLFKKSCTGKHGVGCFKAGQLVNSGRSAAKNKDQARTLYQKACKLGEKRGCKMAERLAPKKIIRPTIKRRR